jgi:hypothetical protein
MNVKLSILATFVVVILALTLISTPGSAHALVEFAFAFGSVGSGDGQFNLPNDIAVDSSGNIYVAD